MADANANAINQKKLGVVLQISERLALKLPATNGNTSHS